MGCGGYCVQGSGGLGAAVNKIRFCVWTFIAIAGPLVRIRLDARSDQPWRREGFRHPDLMIWGRANRARLVAACLTLCQAWAGAGRPPAARSLGSFETWSQTLGGILHVAGVPGFLGNLDEVMEASDSEGGIRANEHRMRSMGFDTYWLQLGAFTLAGAMAGIAGHMWGMTQAFVSPELLA